MLLATVFVYIYVIFTGFGKRNFIGGTLCSAIVIISGAMMWFLCSSNGYNTTIANNTIITIVVLFTATAVVTAIYTWAFEDVFAKASPFIFRVVVSIPFIGVVFGAPFIFVVRKRAQMIR
ncbi:hypothetical protein MNBD_CPR01-261 [hydrothermal vent metagenome]|uniref:Uncharacterized protein n=1 Tax=hydrothermal vent metagenome TaxID=652676 RepID=A0A3B0UNP7_9ZZZZ